MALLTMNRRLFKAYLFKEQFEHAWTYRTEQGMRGFLQRWRRLLNWSRLPGRSAATPRAFSRAMLSFATTPSV
jgi:hypothetical protein